MTPTRPRRGSPDHPLIIDIYARISHETTEDREHRRAANTADQIADCAEEVQDRGAVVGRVHEDVSISAWNRGVVRPEWQALMARLRTGEADGVIFQDVSRFTRKIREGEDLVDAARAGSLVWSIGGDYDLTKTMGRKQFRDAVHAAEHESDQVSDRTRRGKRRKATQRGRSNASWRGFAMPGYARKPAGWLPGDPRETVPEEQVQRERDAVNEMADRMLRGATLDSVTRWLKSEDIRTVTGRTFTSADVRQLLSRPSLAGILIYAGEPVGTLPGEPAMDRAKWDAVQAMFASRKRGRPAQVYLLSGLLHCGHCGAVMYGRPRTSRAPYADGVQASEYWCRKNADGTGCGRLSIDRRAADAVVEQALLTRLSDPEHAGRIAARTADTREARARVLAEIARLEEQADALADKVGAWGVARVERAMGTVLEALEAQRTALRAIDGPETLEAARAGTVEEWEAATLTARRAMVRRTFPRLALLPAGSRGTRVDNAARMALEGLETA